MPVAPAVNAPTLTLGFNKDDYLGALVRLKLYHPLWFIFMVSSPVYSFSFDYNNGYFPFGEITMTKEDGHGVIT